VVGALVMGHCADGAVRVVIQIVVMVDDGVQLRAEKQQQHKCRQVVCECR